MKFLWSWFLLSSSLGFAYPELIRFGYTNCLTCHHSPQGGGLLTPYGRSLSHEVLSTWGEPEKETQFLYGRVPFPKWLEAGGDIRAIQVYQNTPRYEQAKFILMQADLEAALIFDQWKLIGTVGRQDPSGRNTSGGSLFSRRHYVSFQPTDYLNFRLGKFQQGYGILLADHTAFVKRYLNFDEGSETYQIEGLFFNEKWEVFLTGNLGRLEDARLNLDKGVYLRGAYLPTETIKVGWGYYFGRGSGQSRHLTGPFALIGLSKKWVVLSEIDFQYLVPDSRASQWGVTSYLKLNYEILQGLNVYALQEYSQANFSSVVPSESYGLGVQFFPRPHLEIQLQYQKSKIPLLGNDFSDVAFLQGHFYL